MASVRKLGPEHIEPLCTLEAALFDAANFPLSRRNFAYHIKKGTPLWCLFEKEQLAGYILLFVYKKSGRIYSLAVDPEFSGKGYGKILLQKAVDALKTEGKEKLFLEVREENKKAIRLYEGVGFKISRRLPAYYGDGAEGIKMFLPL